VLGHVCASVGGGGGASPASFFDPSVQLRLHPASPPRPPHTQVVRRRLQLSLIAAPFTRHTIPLSSPRSKRNTQSTKQRTMSSQHDGGGAAGGGGAAPEWTGAGGGNSRDTMMIPSRATTSAAAVLLLVCLLGGAVEPAASSYIHSPIARGASSMAIEGATGITSLSKERYICIHATCPRPLPRPLPVVLTFCIPGRREEGADSNHSQRSHAFPRAPPPSYPPLYPPSCSKLVSIPQPQPTLLLSPPAPPHQRSSVRGGAEPFARGTSTIPCAVPSSLATLVRHRKQGRGTANLSCPRTARRGAPRSSWLTTRRRLARSVLSFKTSRAAPGKYVVLVL
jgi:hypothetical protein